MKNKRKRRGSLAAASEIFDIPADVALGGTRVTVTGSSRVLIENHRGILHYGDDCINVACSGGSVSVQGEGLNLGAMNGKDLVICGRIHSVELDGIKEQRP